MWSLKEWIHDRYCLEAILNEKPGRKTFLATDRLTRSKVIIKLLLFSASVTWEEVKLFEREAEVLQSFNHKAIPQYVDRFDLALPNIQGFAVVQTWIAAKSLKQHLENGRRFSELEIQQIAEQVLSILHDLHTHSPPIIHRDLKPSNILLGERSGNYVGQVYLIDFGSVQNVAATQDGTFTITGTYGYMPPEQFSGRTFPASDLYSLGATLVELLTGLDPAELPHQNGSLQIEESICSKPFYHWLVQLLQPNPNQRFESAQQALEALQHPDRRMLDRAFFQNHPQIRLNVDRELLHLVILPDRALNISLTNFISFTVLPLALLILSIPVRVLLLIPLAGPVLYIAALGGLAFLFVWTLFEAVQQSLLHHFCKTQLRSQSETIQVKKTILGLTVYKKAYSIVQIQSIEWSKSYIQIEHKIPNRYIPASITLKTERKPSQITPLNDQEAEMLAQVLGNYLEVPVHCSDQSS
ncbi:serine/threonine kinase [Leptolyngbya sp. NIES-3755]|nr:serine/threonine kinase [Leptolyngbya sp. NIES-3755]